jgi:hypothetical protein
MKGCGIPPQQDARSITRKVAARRGEELTELQEIFPVALERVRGCRLLGIQIAEKSLDSR